ncbi:peptidoglycan/LPS O-acetylase OafA/YrhL [Rahnella sp. BIGb0236]|uniref:acyltransferase family protein n=1 Tax=Rahnella sp. BIGb0236 TaxID=2485117 RepID=UPI00105ED791|nr:acyltransferase [Rahnella sp. BIGb0236]TDS87110.1 peptidoglycan/LPS O-acetylase OafA/YrhL [Rahnella sp. BIGb0236]VTQ52866.1 Acyltransferase family [Campylobacter jejuni]
MNKITHLEGLRGLCCFIVIFDHCVTAFYGGLRFTGDSGFIGNLKQFLAWSPLNLIYSGIPSVYIFFILSGFVLSNKYNIHKNTSILVSSSLKRYPRLIAPIFFSMLIMFFIYEISDTFFNTHYPMTFLDVFYQSFVYVPFGGGKLENGALWTITYELYGSFLVFGLLAVFGNYKYKYFVYLLVFIMTFKTYYCIFIFGMTINSLMHDDIQFKFKDKKIAILTIIFSLFLISFPYPREGVDVGGVYNYLWVLSDHHENYQFVVKIGSILLFLGLFSIPGVNSFFDTAPLQFMGKISFSVYILHVPFLVLVLNFKHFFDISLIRLIILSSFVYLLTIITAIFFEKFIDEKSVKYTNILAKRIS